MINNGEYWINVFPLYRDVPLYNNGRHVFKSDAINGAIGAEKRTGSKCLYRIKVTPKTVMPCSE